MSITNFTLDDLSRVFHDGLMKPLRAELKRQLMQTLEKEIDTAVETVLQGMKGYVKAHRDFSHDRIVFDVSINGIKKGIE